MQLYSSMWWVIARDEHPEGDRFWICVNPARLDEARWIEAASLADLATGTAVQTAWVDVESNVVSEGAYVHADSVGPYAEVSDAPNAQLDKLPTRDELLWMWNSSPTLRVNSRDAWEPTESRDVIAQAHDAQSPIHRRAG